MLNGYASAVILAARKHRDERLRQRGSGVWRRLRFQQRGAVPRADEGLLLRAMVQTFLDRALCIAEDTPDGRQLIFPSCQRSTRHEQRALCAHFGDSFTPSPWWELVAACLASCVC